MVLSSAEKRQKNSRRDPSKPPPECLPGDYEGIKIPVTITGDHPIVDLGTINLKPVQKPEGN